MKVMTIVMPDNYRHVTPQDAFTKLNSKTIEENREKILIINLISVLEPELAYTSNSRENFISFLKTEVGMTDDEIIKYLDFGS